MNFYQWCGSWMETETWDQFLLLLLHDVCSPEYRDRQKYFNLGEFEFGFDEVRYLR